MTKTPDKKPQKVEENNEKFFAFTRENYKWVIIGLAVILVGFILMIGGNSDDPNVFNEGIFNFRRLTLAPILVLIGFCIELYAIMKKTR